MRIAIIGGGSAGLVAAYLLDSAHQVTVFERAPILGGHVRTLHGNVKSDLAPGVFLDAGVVEFERRNFPTLMRLFHHLGCKLREVPGTTTFWTHRGVHHLAPGALSQADPNLLERMAQLVDLMGLRLQAAAFHWRSDLPEEDLDSRSLGDVLTQADADRWAALLTTYAYSIPYERVLEVPAALAIPMLRDFEEAEGWVSLVGGSWSYLQAMLDRFSGTVHCDAHVALVTRQAQGVTLHMADGSRLPFDKVVFAAPPDQTLRLLGDATDAERRRFGAWQPNHIHTLLHCDPSVYTRREVTVRTEFDVIETGPGQGGYNAFLNRLCGVPEDGVPYGLAFGIDGKIDPTKVLLRQDHHTPGYDVPSYRWHREVIATNGEHHTLHVGAWLGDGLQEGAVTSAEAASRLLGGRGIPG